MKRILLDQGLAPFAASLLRQVGFDAIHASELGMERADDAEILEFARTDLRVCITLDHDFHAHLAMTGGGNPSVILLRVQGLDAKGQASLVQPMYLQCAVALSGGAAVSADGETIRVRRLPLGNHTAETRLSHLAQHHEQNQP